MLLLGENDYLAAKRFESDARIPVYVSYLQHYAILKDLADRAAVYFPSARVLIRFHNVYVRPLPPSLLSEQVFLVDDPDAMAATLLRSGVSEILVIDDRIRRDSAERGDNTVRITLHANAPSSTHFAEYLRDSVIARGCAGN